MNEPMNEEMIEKFYEFLRDNSDAINSKINKCLSEILDMQVPEALLYEVDNFIFCSIVKRGYELMLLGYSKHIDPDEIRSNLLEQAKFALEQPKPKKNIFELLGDLI